MRKGKLVLFILLISILLYNFSYLLRPALNIASQKIPFLEYGVRGMDANVDIKYVRQLVGKDETQRTIMFAASTHKNYVLELSAESRFLDKSVFVPAKDMSFTDNKNNYIQYQVELKDLKAGVKYKYRINDEKNKGSWHELEVPKDKNFTALIFSDSQSGDGYLKYEKLFNQATSANSTADLWLNLGDQVDNGEHQYQWDRWLQIAEKISPDTPMAALVGNHECYDMNWKERLPVAHVNLFQFPNGIEKYKNQFYSFNYGDVHFICLDTNYRWEVLKFQPDIAREQIAWLKNDLANNKSKWTVVLMHRDICLYKFADREPRWDTHFIATGTDFMPIFEKYNVDVVLSGHLHSYRRRKPIKNFVYDEKGITYVMLGVAGTQAKETLWADWSLDAKRSSEKDDETSCYMTMDASDSKLSFKAFLADGTEFDEFSFSK